MVVGMMSSLKAQIRNEGIKGTIEDQHAAPRRATLSYLHRNLGIKGFIHRTDV